MNRGTQVTGVGVADEVARIKTSPGAARLAAIWAKAEEASTLDTADLRIDWLQLLMREASAASRIDFKLRAFCALRRIYETDPRYADLRDDLLGYFKWLAEELPEHAEPSRQVIEQVFAEMERLYRACGASPRPIYALRCQAALRMGYIEQADACYQTWQALPRGQADDCEACDRARQILYLLNRERYEEAIAAAEPILRREVWCDQTPETLTRLVPAAMETDRQPLAVTLLKLSSRAVRRAPGMLGGLGVHVLFRFFLADPVRSRRLAILALRRAREAYNDLDRFNVYHACGLWAAIAVSTPLHEWTLPRRIMPAPRDAGADLVSLAEVAGLCLAEACRIAARLDTRNGTTRYADHLRELESKVRELEQHTGDPLDRPLAH